jgi:hypothetical protein
MASIYGTSRAWKEIAAHLEIYQLKAGHPSEIALLLQGCTRDFSEQFDDARQAIEAEIAALEQEVAKEKEKVRVELDKFSDEHTLEIKQAELAVDFYRHERSLFNFVRSFFRIRRETGKLEELQKTLQEDRDEIEHDLREKESQLSQIKTTKNQIAQAACREAYEKVEILKSISGSQELAGAVVEFEMIDTLARLPDNFHVINDVRLQVDRGLRFEGEWLISGEISNLVVTPAGLFAIEVTSGAKQAEKKEAVFDPREQIKRAAHLCYSFLKPEFPAVTVRSILAYRGHLPESEKTGIVKTLPIPDVPAYITWFKENTLAEALMREIVEYVLEVSGQRQ